jgi:hypothetical protein
MGAEKRKTEAQVAPLFNKRPRESDSDRRSAKEDLATRLVTHTRKKIDPFLQDSPFFGAPKPDMLANVVLKNGHSANGK